VPPAFEKRFARMAPMGEVDTEMSIGIVNVGHP
jgi:hypothetical protein